MHTDLDAPSPFPSVVGKIGVIMPELDGRLHSSRICCHGFDGLDGGLLHQIPQLQVIRIQLDLQHSFDCSSLLQPPLIRGLTSHGELFVVDETSPCTVCLIAYTIHRKKTSASAYQHSVTAMQTTDSC